jgi:hypothetical protein
MMDECPPPKEVIKQIAVDFFSWWFGQEGTTSQGFDEFWKQEGWRYSGVSQED